MKKITLFSILLLLFLCHSCNRQATNNSSILRTSETQTIYNIESGKIIPCDTFDVDTKSPLLVTLVGHGSLMLEYEGNIIHVDPFSQIADYAKLPKADLILITHEHFDHLDTLAINQIKKSSASFITSRSVSNILGFGEVLNNGEQSVWNGINIAAVPAYNIVHKTSKGEFYHPKERDNGYVLTIGAKKIYIAGDTENIPEMENLKGTIEIAFLPKNLPYTMDSDMFVDATLKVKPKYLYTYHCNQDDLQEYKQLDEMGITQFIRRMSNK